MADMIWRATTWIPVEHIYAERKAKTKAGIEGVTFRPTSASVGGFAFASNLLRRGKGVYLLADGEPDHADRSELGYQDVVYIGHAGGVGEGSNFHSRIHKHLSKARGWHKNNGGPKGISISKKWSDWVADHWSNGHGLTTTSGLYVRFVTINDGFATQVGRAEEMERLLMHFWHILASGEQAGGPNRRRHASPEIARLFSGAIDRSNASQSGQGLDDEFQKLLESYESHFHDREVRLPPCNTKGPGTGRGNAPNKKERNLESGNMLAAGTHLVQPAFPRELDVSQLSSIESDDTHDDCTQWQCAYPDFMLRLSLIAKRAGCDVFVRRDGKDVRLKRGRWVAACFQPFWASNGSRIRARLPINLPEISHLEHLSPVGQKDGGTLTKIEGSPGEIIKAIEYLMPSLLAVASRRQNSADDS